MDTIAYLEASLRKRKKFNKIDTRKTHELLAANK
jgi:hypothetical protein